MDLVTGGAGFIGSHLVEALVRRGRRVRVIDDLSTGRLDRLEPVRDDVELIEGDVRDRSAIRAAMRGVERVFHLAARAADHPGPEGDAVAALSVLRAARDAGVGRVVHASCWSVYGPTAPSPLREDCPARPASPAAAARLAAEDTARHFARAHGLPVVMLRYFSVFGPGQTPAAPRASVVARFVAAALGDQPLQIHGDGLQSRDFVYVDDAVRATCLAAESDGAAGEVINVGTGRRLTLLDVVQAMGPLLAGHARTIRWQHGAARTGAARHVEADPGKAARLLGFRAAVRFEEGLQRTVAALLQDGFSRPAVLPMRTTYA